MSIWTRIIGYYTASEAIVWLTSPHPQLDGATAAELIRAGRTAEVEAVLDRLDSGVYL